MASSEVDEYLRRLDEPARSTLESVRGTILELLPDAEQGISYGMPAFRSQGKVVAGLAAFKNHLSYLPHSGSVLGELRDETASYTCTKSSLHFPHDEPLPRDLVRKLIDVRLRQLGRVAR
jgi:uncharacterized protein YdhG (YjbR/CyaY superfamily)